MHFSSGGVTSPPLHTGFITTKLRVLLLSALAGVDVVLLTMSREASKFQPPSCGSSVGQFKAKQKSFRA